VVCICCANETIGDVAGDVGAGGTAGFSVEGAPINWAVDASSRSRAMVSGRSYFHAALRGGTGGAVGAVWGLSLTPGQEEACGPRGVHWSAEWPVGSGDQCNHGTGSAGSALWAGSTRPAPAPEPGVTREMPPDPS